MPFDDYKFTKLDSRSFGYSGEEVIDQVLLLAQQVSGCFSAFVSFNNANQQWVKFENKSFSKSDLQKMSVSLSSFNTEFKFQSISSKIKEKYSFDYSDYYFCTIPLFTQHEQWVGTIVLIHSEFIEVSERVKKSLQAIAHQCVFISNSWQVKAHFLEAEKVAKIGSWHYDVESQKITWSEQLFEIFGLSPEAGEPSFEHHKNTIHPDDREAWESAVEACSTNGTPYEIEFRGTPTSGEVVWLKAFGKAFRDKNGKIVSMGGTCQDISTSKELELKNEEIREKSTKLLEGQKRFLSSTLDNMPAVVYAKDVEGKFIAINEVFRKLFELSDDDVLGKDNHEIFPKDIADAFRENDLEIIETRAVQESEEVAIGKDGKKRAYYSYKFPYFDEDGNVIATGGVSLDITEKKELERQALHNAKLASIGELAAGVGHEINNPLTIVKGYVASILSRLQNGSLDNITMEKSLEQIDKASDRIAKIVLGLRNFSRLEDDGFSNINVLDPLKESVDMVKDIFGQSGTNIDFRHPTTFNVVVYGSPGKLQQVFMNLLANSRDATRDQDDRRISVELKTCENKAVISFKDNGTGIPEEVKERIFDPFFTTKGVNEGTGIGLSIAHSIIKEHGGEIHCESSQGNGTTFSIELPISKEQVLEKNSEQVVSSSQKNYSGIKALVVDDEEGIRFILKEMLEDVGVQVSCAANGKEGLEAAAQDGFDIIISDMKMPVMDGPSFIRKLRDKQDSARLPKIVFNTGGVNMDLEDENGELKSLCDGILLKPFTKETIAEILMLVSPDCK